MHKVFTSQSIRHLRLRLGWSQGELARHLNCSVDQVLAFEEGHLIPEAVFSSELEIIEKHADQLSEELHIQPIAENRMEEEHLQQMDSTEVLSEV